jgi:hypothetical protein
MCDCSYLDCIYLIPAARLQVFFFKFCHERVITVMSRSSIVYIYLVGPNKDYLYYVTGWGALCQNGEECSDPVWARHELPRHRKYVVY